ncbi:GDSL esterase/lipase At1g29670-like [Nymphaea colorata]|nr:GDSL esterase/lipase At1g29670-like [Nymphaea colorata]
MLNSFSFFVIFFFLLPSFSVAVHSAAKEPPLAMFVFGDSVFDNGNNLFLSTSLSKANYLPYGVDMGGPSGRFTNEKNPADVLGEFLGLKKLIPAFLNPEATGEEIVHGVNYASAGSGILDSTLNTSSLPLNTQINYFENTTLPGLRSLMNESQLSAYLSEAIFVFNSGANDYEQSCFSGENSSDIYCSMSDFTILLANELIGQFKKLYILGARKFVLFAIQVIGCSPLARSMSTTSECMGDFNFAAKLFNDRMLNNIDNITQAMPGSNVVFVNTYGILDKFLENPAAYGFTVTNASCCETTAESYYIACLEGGTVCGNRSEYVFFDGVHPTRRVYEAISSKAFLSDLTGEVYPFNVMKLANLTSGSKVGGSVLESRAWESFGKNVQ